MVDQEGFVFVRPFVLALIGCLVATGHAQSYLGAEGALKAIKSRSAVAPKRPDPAVGLRRAIDAYKHRARGLSPVQSAQQWLALASPTAPSEAIWALERRRSGPGDSSFAKVMSALPSPAVWPELERQLRGRVSGSKRAAKDLALLALVETLRGERTQARAHLDQLKTLSLEQQVLRSHVLVDLAMIGEDKDQIADAYRKQAITLSLPTEASSSDRTMELPDLAVMLGPNRARVLLGDIFRTFNGEVVINGGASFKKMAREKALVEVAKLKHPQWNLAIDVEGGPLFEALHKRFPDSNSGIQQNRDWANDSYSAAATRYTAYLIANHRAADAAAFAKNQESPYWFGGRIVDEEVDLLKNRAVVQDYVQFLETLISGSTDGLVIRDYVEFCDAVGQSEHANRFVAGLPAAKRVGLRDAWERTLDELMAKDNVEEAGRLLQKVVEEPPDPKSNLSGYAASRLADIGHFLHRQDYVDLAFSAGERAFRSEHFAFINGWVCLVLAKDHRGPEAERLLADVLQWEAHDSGQSPPGGKEELECLVQVYAGAQRYEDVLALLEGAPNWGVSDVAFFDNLRKRQNSVVFICAQALAAVGRRKEALHVLRFVLQSQSDLDQAYELLLKLDPDGAGPLLDTMHRVSPTATRPLMWKAELLRRKGRLADAEMSVRQAIALDPQDTQAWESSTRFQAWAILAGVERAQGKVEAALIHQRKFDSPGKYFTNNGSDVYTLDIRGPATRLKALADNPDDFSLMFAVASDLNRAGKRDEAKARILEACRLLPSNIGPAGQVNWWDDDPEFARACEDLLRAEIRKDPNKASTHAVLGDLVLHLLALRRRRHMA